MSSYCIFWCCSSMSAGCVWTIVGVFNVQLPKTRLPPSIIIFFNFVCWFSFPRRALELLLSSSQHKSTINHLAIIGTFTLYFILIILTNYCVTSRVVFISNCKMSRSVNLFPSNFKLNISPKTVVSRVLIVHRLFQRFYNIIPIITHL